MSRWGFEPRLYDDAGYVEPNGAAEGELLSVVEHVLSELYDLILLCQLEELARTAIPLAEEIAARYMWRTPVASTKREKSYSRKSMDAAPSVYTLPAKQIVQDRPRVKPRFEAHPLHGLDVQDVTFNPITNSDTQRPVIQALEALGEIDERLPHTRDTSRLPQIHTWVQQLAIAFDPNNVPDDYVVLGAEISELYIRDKSYALARSTATRMVGQLPDVDVPWLVELAKSRMFPYLADERVAVAEEVDTGASGQCFFRPSVYVPEGVKPPSAGVITDKNLHYGRFVHSTMTHEELRGLMPSCPFFSVRGDAGNTVPGSGSDVADTAAPVEPSR